MNMFFSRYIQVELEFGSFLDVSRFCMCKMPFFRLRNVHPSEGGW